MTYDTQWRATFEDTKNNQEELRLFLDELDKNNAFVKEKERGTFFEYLANGLLGLDYKKDCKIKLPNGKKLTIEDLGEFLRFIAYYDNTKVESDFLIKYGIIENTSIRIGDIWHQLKFIIYGIYPEALSVSVRMSKEREQRDFSAEGGFTFGKKNKS